MDLHPWVKVLYVIISIALCVWFINENGFAFMTVLEAVVFGFGAGIPLTAFVVILLFLLALPILISL
jgi:hypothetical protein